jgi:hypothetical protein
MFNWATLYVTTAPNLGEPPGLDVETKHVLPYGMDFRFSFFFLF